MVDGWGGQAYYAESDEDDDEPPLAPPEPTTTSPPPAPGAEPIEGVEQARDRGDDEPRLAPSEDTGFTDYGLRIVEEVFSGSHALGSDAAMDAVRAWHPHWEEVDADSDVGRWVRWVRHSHDWVYGELASSSFPLLLPALSRSSDLASGTFVDLGSGSGKVAALAALYFSQVVGLELQEALGTLARGLADDFRAQTRKHGVAAGELHLHRADFLGRLTPHWQDSQRQYWWEVADVAYACSPKFCEATMQALGDCAARMRSDSHFVTVRHPLHSDCLEEIWRGEGNFTWGHDELIVYRHR